MLGDVSGRHDRAAVPSGQSLAVRWYIDHPGGIRDLHIGEPIGQRAVCAPEHGILWWREQIRVGMRVPWPSWPAGWLVPAEGGRLRAIVPRTVVDLLRPLKTPPVEDWQDNKLALLRYVDGKRCWRRRFLKERSIYLDQR